MTDLPKPLPYSFLDKAAAEARAESRRYWAKGGEADRKNPVHPIPDWHIPLVDADRKLAASIKRMLRRKKKL